MTVAPPAAGAALELILRATFLIGAAWAIASILRRAGASASARHVAWLAGILALLALPLVWWLAPPLRLPILQPEAAHAVITAAPLDATPFVPESMSAWTLLLIAYLIGAAAVILRFTLSRYLVTRLWRTAQPAQEADWQALLAEVSRELRLNRTLQLRIARGPAMPMTWGTLTPRILLPAEARAWPAEQRRHVLLHEFAHVARRDSLGRSAASLACALYWFHPGIWFAARRLRLEQEHATDDRVLSAGARPRNYARSLLDLAFSIDETRWPDHAAAMAGLCQLERRVVSITGNVRRDAPGAAFHAASATITALTVLAVAVVLPVRPPSSLSGSGAIETVLPAMGAVSEPAEVASGPAEIAAASRPDGETPGLRAFEAPVAAGSVTERAGTARATEAQPITSSVPGQEAANSQTAPPPARQLGPIGPRLQPMPEEQDSDPRIPAGLRRASTADSANQRAGPGPPRTPEEGMLRTLPATILQAVGALPSS